MGELSRWRWKCDFYGTGSRDVKIITVDGDDDGILEHPAMCGPDEIDCEGEDCLFTSSEARTWCEDHGGTVYEEEKTYCKFDDRAAVWTDEDADGKVNPDTEVHCESLNSEGKPSGTKVNCDTGVACETN